MSEGDICSEDDGSMCYSPFERPEKTSFKMGAFTMSFTMIRPWGCSCHTSLGDSRECPLHAEYFFDEEEKDE